VRAILLNKIFLTNKEIKGCRRIFKLLSPSGINLKSFQESNWLKVTAGAVVSVLVHELGHALYLQSQGKDWDLQSSSSYGLAIHTSDPLSENQYRNFK